MKRLCAAIMACILVGAVATTFGQCDDPFDANLCVYSIPDADNQFVADDGLLSPFFQAANWGSNDYIDMIYPDNCYPDRCNFSGADDANLTIKAAGTARGLYVYSEVKDNTWVDRTAQDDWGSDAMDLYFDALSADEIFTCTDCLVGLYASTLSYTTQQFQVWMGATAPPNGCAYQAYDELLWSWQEMGLTWATAAALFGFMVDVISIDGNTKGQEWFFPWEKFGQGIAEGTPLDGMKVGFSGGYNDKDGDSDQPDCLRWLGKDPWAADAQTVNQWGDFELQAGMGNVVYGAIGVTKNAQGRVAGDASLVSTAHFNLQGQKIATDAVRRLPVGSLVMRRHTFANGSQTGEMIRIR